MYIASQVIVVLSDLIYIAAMFTKRKAIFMLMLFVSDVLFAVHFFFLDGGLTGAVVILLDAVYLVVMYLLQKFQKTKFNLLTTLVSIAICGALSIITWQGALSLLPMFSMLTYFVAMIPNSILATKFGSLSRNVLNSIYMFLISSYLGAGFGVALSISAIVGIILNFYQQKHPRKTPATVEGEIEVETVDDSNPTPVQDNSQQDVKDKNI